MLASVAAWGQVDLTAWPQVRVDVVGTDGKGNPLQDLKAEDLTVSEDGHPAQGVELKQATDPVSICLLLDASGSMWESRKDLADTATRLLRELPAADEVCVADFSWSAYVDQDFTLDREADISALRYIKSSGATALYDALSGLADYMRRSARNSSRVIVLLSDGVDNASKVKLPQFLQGWEKAGTPAVDLIRIPSPHSGAEKEKDALELGRLAGGLVYFARNMKDVEASVDQLNESLKDRYQLSFESGSPSKDGHERRIQLELSKALQKAKAVVRAPEGYYAPAQ